MKSGDCLAAVQQLFSFVLLQESFEVLTVECKLPVSGCSARAGLEHGGKALVLPGTFLSLVSRRGSQSYLVEESVLRYEGSLTVSEMVLHGPIPVKIFEHGVLLYFLKGNSHARIRDKNLVQEVTLSLIDLTSVCWLAQQNLLICEFCILCLEGSLTANNVGNQHAQAPDVNFMRVTSPSYNFYCNVLWCSTIRH